MAEILVVTCTKNAHLISRFQRCFHTAWSDCAYPINVLVGEDDGGWADPVIEHSKTGNGPFLILLEDYWLRDVPYPDRIDGAFQVAATDAIGMVRLNPCPGPTLPLSVLSETGRVDVDVAREWGVIQQDANYAVSLQPAIWDAETIQALFRYGETAWETELRGTFRSAEWVSNKWFIGSTETLLPYQNAMRRGKMVPEVVAWYEARFGRVGEGSQETRPDPQEG